MAEDEGDVGRDEDLWARSHAEGDEMHAVDEDGHGSISVIAIILMLVLTSHDNRRSDTIMVLAIIITLGKIICTCTDDGMACDCATATMVAVKVDDVQCWTG